MVRVSSAGVAGLLHGCFCSLDGTAPGEKGSVDARKGLRDSIALERHPAANLCSGDCGPECAAWLLNNHAALEQNRSPYTARHIRQALQAAWRSHLRGDKDFEQFIEQRMSQSSAFDGCDLDNLQTRAEAILESMFAGEGKTSSYHFHASDWERLSESFDVDFVLHGLPGMENWPCPRCGTSGHFHLGNNLDGEACRTPQPSLHVCWWPSTDGNLSCGVWEPWGSSTPQHGHEEHACCSESTEAVDGMCTDSDVEMEIPNRKAPDCLSMWSASAHASAASEEVDACQAEHYDSAGANPLGRYFRKGFQCLDDRMAAKGKGGTQRDPDASDTHVSPRRDSSSDRPLFPGVASEGFEKPTARGLGTPVARFSVILEETTVSGDPAQPLKDEAWLRQAFIAAVAEAANVSEGRVRVLEVGAPLSLEAGLVNLPGETGGKAVGGVARRIPSADDGAGVLRFLEKEEHRSSSKQAGCSATRVLGIIHEADTSAMISGEPSALQALDRVALQLQDTSSPLQMTLKMWSGGQPARFWMPSSPTRLQHRQPRLQGRAARLLAARTSAEGLAQQALLGAASARKLCN